METVVSVMPLKNCAIDVVFSDGVRATIDIRPFIKPEGISNRLYDEVFFNTVTVDESGGVAWDNGFDFCPVFLRSMLPG